MNKTLKLLCVTGLLSISGVAAGAATPPSPAIKKVGTTTPSNAATVKTGVQTTFTVPQLTGNNAARITGSTNYQVSIVFPRKIQSIGVNAAKQQAVMPTIDQYDGRVVYIDVLKSGGTATLNFRMLSAADAETEKNGKDATKSSDPIILKMVLELTDKDNGVLSYLVTEGGGHTAVRIPPPSRAATPARVSTPAPTSAVRIPPPSRAATPARVSTPAPTSAARTPAATTRPSTGFGSTLSRIPATSPTSRLSDRRTAPVTLQGSNRNLSLTLTPSYQSATDQAYNYVVTATPQDGKSYFLDTSLTSIRVKNIDAPGAVKVSNTQQPVTPDAPAKGSLMVSKSVVNQDLPRVLMFTVLEKDNKSGATRRFYVGVLLK